MVRRNYKDPSVYEPFLLGDFLRFSLIFFFLGDRYCFSYKFAAITSVIPDMKQLRKWRNKKKFDNRNYIINYLTTINHILRTSKC